jgi:hypothetical protein
VYRYVCLSSCTIIPTAGRRRKKPPQKVKGQKHPIKTPQAPMLNDVYSFRVWSLFLSVFSVNFSLSLSLSLSQCHV